MKAMARVPGEYVRRTGLQTASVVTMSSTRTGEPWAERMNASATQSAGRMKAPTGMKASATLEPTHAAMESTTHAPMETAADAAVKTSTHAAMEAAPAAMEAAAHATMEPATPASMKAAASKTAASARARLGHVCVEQPSHCARKSSSERQPNLHAARSSQHDLLHLQ
jgi:hypothetical protein